MLASVVALSAFQAIRLQVSGIYFHASVAKLLVTEWQDGTAMYYWLSNPVFGAPDALRGLLRPLLRSALFLGAITWTPIVVELALCMGLFATRPVRRVLLWVGIGLHLGILVFMGLFTFSVTMFGALVLYLRPTDTPFVLGLDRIRTWLASRARMRRSRAEQSTREGYVSS